MILKIAQPEDLSAIEDLFKDFYHATINYDREKTLGSIQSLIEKNSVIVSVIDGVIAGGIAGYVTPCLFTKDIYFVAMFFYFREGYRHHVVEFLKKINEVIETTEATHLVVANPEVGNYESMNRFYQMNGFKQLETHYIREVKREEVV